MSSTLTAVLCLGICLSQRINTEKQVLPKPIIWAKPSTRVTKGNPVDIWCQGAQSAAEYQLYFEESFYDMKRPNPHKSMNKVKFFIPQMTSQTAGRYTCLYQSGELQSKYSDTLILVVTGLYDTPNLWVHPGPEVTLGENVTFFCHLRTATSTFFLLKEGRSNHIHDRYGNIQAEFPMGPMTRAHRGTYRCFGSYNKYVWSFPSEPVTLLIQGIENTTLAPADPTSSIDYYWEFSLATKESGLQKGSAFWDHTTQNLIRIGLTCVVLVTLVWLLAEDWISRKRDQEGTNRSSSWECRRQRVPRSLEEEQRETISMTELKVVTPGSGVI